MQKIYLRDLADKYIIIYCGYGLKGLPCSMVSWMPSRKPLDLSDQSHRTESFFSAWKIVCVWSVWVLVVLSSMSTLLFNWVSSYGRFVNKQSNISELLSWQCWRTVKHFYSTIFNLKLSASGWCKPPGTAIIAIIFSCNCDAQPQACRLRFS